MHLESPKVSVKKSANQLFDFLTEVSNFESIMPENIDKFEALDQSFIFALKGMPSIKLKLGSLEKPTKIVLDSASDKFPFSLTGTISEIDDSTSNISLNFEGDFNAMMAMMIKNPLQKFIDTLADNLSKL
jgi:hypothetical protein